MPRWLRIAAGLIVIATASLAAQFDRPSQRHRIDLPYDGRFTFVRLRWKSDLARRGGFRSAWDHDFPRAEQHLSQIVKEITALDIHTDGSLILTLDDPELFKYPIAFMWEPGFWNLTDPEAGVVPRLPAEGRLRRVRGLRRRRSVGELRSADAARAAGRPVLQAGQGAPRSSTRSSRSRTSTRSCIR